MLVSGQLIRLACIPLAILAFLVAAKLSGGLVVRDDVLQVVRR